MMESADLRDAEDPASGRRLDFAWNWRVAIQRQVRPHLVIVFQVIAEDSLEVPVAEHDEVIETLTTNRTDQTFHVGAKRSTGSTESDIRRVLPMLPDPHGHDLLNRFSCTAPISCGIEGVARI